MNLYRIDARPKHWWQKGHHTYVLASTLDDATASGRANPPIEGAFDYRAELLTQSIHVAPARG